METQTNKNSQPTKNPAIRNKISVKTVKTSDLPVGASFSGKFMGFSEGQPFNQIDEKTGEIVTKSLRFMVMEDLNTGERLSYVADKGLQDSISTAMVTNGQKIEIIKLEKVKLPKGRTMNQYDIFDLGN